MYQVKQRGRGGARVRVMKRGGGIDGSESVLQTSMEMACRGEGDKQSIWRRTDSQINLIRFRHRKAGFSCICCIKAVTITCCSPVC